MIVTIIRLLYKDFRIVEEVDDERNTACQCNYPGLRC